jgi:sugar lactone lactonase YvrE
MYACQGKAKKVVAYDKTGKEELIAEGIAGNDLCVNHKGGIYVTEPSAQPRGLVWYIAPGTHEKKTVDSGITFPNGVRLTPDQTQLVVADTRGPSCYLFTIRPDGTLADKSPFYACDCSHTRVGSGADGLTFDVTGRLFVATYLGLQMFDPAGRVNGILSRPQYGKSLSNVVFGGKDFDILYVTCGDKVYKRKVGTKGLLSGLEPIVPPMPSP